MNLNGKQLIAISIAILSVIAGGSAQLTTIFGQGYTQIIVAVATLGTTALSSILAVITSQGSQIKDVLAMPGVDKVSVNAAANQTLAAIAIDPSVNKISPTQSALDQVTATAKGT
jgi:hypothetical protein